MILVHNTAANTIDKSHKCSSTTRDQSWHLFSILQGGSPDSIIFWGLGRFKFSRYYYI